MIYPPNQKPPIWAIDSGVVAYNCQKHGMPHPVLAMPMWDGAGTRAIDLSGHNNFCSLSGPPKWIADGLDFNGSSDYISSTAIIGDIDLSQPWSISVRLKIRTLSDYPNYAGFCDQDGNEYVFIGNDNSIPRKLKIVSAGKTAGNGSEVVSGTVHNIVVVWDGTKLTAYLNGVFDYDVTPSPALNWGVMDIFMIGAKHNPGLSSYLNGHEYNATVFQGALTPIQVKFLHDNPYFMYQVPEELYGYVAVLTDTGLLDCKLRIKNSSTSQADGLIILKDKKIDLFDGNLSILDAATNDADGKVQIQDVATNAVDGKAVVKDTDTNLSDGKVQVKDTATTLADGKVILQDAATGIADGKISVKDVATGLADSLIRIKDSIADLADGKLRIKDTVSALADGKVLIQNIGTNLADGKLRIKDVVTAFVDGKISVNIPGTDTGYVDGNIKIKDVTTSIVDGAIKIKDVATGTADGLLKIIERITSNVDGKLNIKDRIKNIADGKINISGGAVAVIRRISIANKKPSYRLTPENQKPTYRLETSSNLTTDIILSPSNTLYPSDTLYPNGKKYYTIRISEGS